MDLTRVGPERLRWWSELSGAQELGELERDFCCAVPVTLERVEEPRGDQGMGSLFFHAAATDRGSGRVVAVGTGRDPEAAAWDRMEQLLTLAGVVDLDRGVTRWTAPSTDRPLSEGPS